MSYIVNQGKLFKIKTNNYFKGICSTSSIFSSGAAADIQYMHMINQ